MKIPDRETSCKIIHMTDMLLSCGGNTLPVGLKVALREYKSSLLAECAGEKWARVGYPTHYASIADIIGQQIKDGNWKPGERMPSADYLAAWYGGKPKTVRSAMHVLTVRGLLAREGESYYVLPSKTAL